MFLYPYIFTCDLNFYFVSTQILKHYVRLVFFLVSLDMRIHDCLSTWSAWPIEHVMMLLILLFVRVTTIYVVREGFAFFTWEYPLDMTYSSPPMTRVVWGLWWRLDRGPSPFLGTSDRLFWCTRALSHNSDAFQKTE